MAWGARFDFHTDSRCPPCIVPRVLDEPVGRARGVRTVADGEDGVVHVLRVVCADRRRVDAALVISEVRRDVEGDTYWPSGRQVVLESHLVADQVELVDASPHFGLLSLQGPKTTNALESVGLKLPEELFAHTQVTQNELGEWYLMRNDRLGQVGCDLYIHTAHLPGAAKRLAKAVAGQGGGLAGWEAIEIARIESGIPRFACDMEENTLPPEANLESRAISYSKGCYIGQEIIARIRTYGKVNRTLVGYRLDDELAKTATPGTKLVEDTGKAVATITSVAHSPAHGPIALGLAKRTHAELGQVLTAESPATGQATVASLPFS